MVLLHLLLKIHIYNPQLFPPRGFKLFCPTLYTHTHICIYMYEPKRLPSEHSLRPFLSIQHLTVINQRLWFSVFQQLYLISLENNKYFNFISSTLCSHWFVSRMEWKTLSGSGSRTAVVMKGCPAFTLYYTTHYISNDDLSTLPFLLAFVQNKKYSSQVIVRMEEKSNPFISIKEFP